MNVIVAGEPAQGDLTEMKHFSITDDGNITVHATKKAAKETGAAVFSSEEQLGDLIGADGKRMVEVWNSLTGAQPVKKFANRKAGVAKIWEAIQNLGGASKPEPVTPFEAPDLKASAAPEAPANVSAQAPDVARAEAKAGRKPARGNKPAEAPVEAKGARQGSKAAIILELLKQPQGATLEQIMKATSWLPHSVRGYISTLQKKTGLVVESVKTEDGERRYSIK